VIRLSGKCCPLPTSSLAKVRPTVVSSSEIALFQSLRLEGVQRKDLLKYCSTPYVVEAFPRICCGNNRCMPSLSEVAGLRPYRCRAILCAAGGRWIG
jgi:hypothetical protein